MRIIQDFGLDEINAGLAKNSTKGTNTSILLIFSFILNSIIFCNDRKKSSIKAFYENFI